MQETRQGDVRIYIVSTLFFVCIFTGGAFLCLYMLLPEEQSASWYPIVGIVLIGIPWMFWIFTYIYRCFSHCFSVSNRGGNVKRELSSLTKKKSCASEEQVGKSIPSLSGNEVFGSSLGTPNGDHQVRFGDIVVLGDREYNQDEHEHGDKSPREDALQFFETKHGEGKENFQDGVDSDEDHISAASWKGEEPLIV